MCWTEPDILTSPAQSGSTTTPTDPSPEASVQQARQVMFSLMFPSMLMPMVSTMSQVALPLIRDEFQLQADVIAWVAATFTLPFMLLTPVYGRLSDGVDPKRLILMGIVIYAAGATLVMSATTIPAVMIGNLTLGLGVGGMMPMAMSVISSLFSEKERGRALGTWSSIGPSTGFVSPFIAGVIAAAWGWRSSYAPALIASVVTFLVVWTRVPSGTKQSGDTRSFLKTFDWLGFVFLGGGVTTFVLFLSSRAITGVEPMRDWRLLGMSVGFLVLFGLWVRRRANPIVPPRILANLGITTSSFCAATRMMAMSGLSFLIPLYLVDIHDLEPVELGAMLVINSGAMATVTRFGGLLADRWGTRIPASIGLLIQISVMFIFWNLSGDTSLFVVGGSLALHGLGAGLMLASFHRYVMGTVKDAHRGAAAGFYSMVRFLGAVIGTAIAGVCLKKNLDAGLDLVAAYQETFIILAIFPIAGVLVVQTLKESRREEVVDPIFDQ